MTFFRAFWFWRAVAFIALGAILGLGWLFFSEEKPIQTVSEEVSAPEEMAIGSSVQGRSITAHRYGSGSEKILFVGGIHGGYEWNSVLLAYRAMEYLDEHPERIPENLTVFIIPSLNPDAVATVAGTEGIFSAEDVSDNAELLAAARFNARNVDLNRNFDCKWQREGVWRGTPVSAGTMPFSEPESRALRNFVEREDPQAVFFWHSQASAVYASECTEGVLPETRALMQIYADASGYAAIETFDSYEVTGDAEGWLASIGIPALTVELASHESIEWEQNLAGMLAVFSHYRTAGGVE